jgi:hypothetical protein
MYLSNRCKQISQSLRLYLYAAFFIFGNMAGFCGIGFKRNFTGFDPDCGLV